MNSSRIVEQDETTEKKLCISIASEHVDLSHLKFKNGSRVGSISITLRHRASLIRFRLVSSFRSAKSTSCEAQRTALGEKKLVEYLAAAAASLNKSDTEES